MSRLDDLIDLIQTTNEVYFITAPGRVRTAFILVDDIIELALKSYLQMNAEAYREHCQTILAGDTLVTNGNHRRAFKQYCQSDIDHNGLHTTLGVTGADIGRLNRHLASFDDDRLRHWTLVPTGNFIHFPDLLDEVRTLNSSDTPLLEIIDRIAERHTRRNQFFHDQRQSGLTIADSKCLRALCDLFSLMETLFPAFERRVQDLQVVRCQIGVLRLKLSASGSSDLTDTYNRVLEEFGNNVSLNRWSKNFEHTVLHIVSDRFFLALKQEFEDSIAKLETRIDKINQMRRQTAKHHRELQDKQNQLGTMQNQLTKIESLFSQ